MQVERNEAFLKALGLRIRSLRKEKGLTQEQLGNIIDMDGQNVGRIERGEINPGACTLLIIAKGIGVNMSELFRFEFEE